MKTFFLYSDGAARGNPGPAGAGWLVCDAQGEPLKENCRSLGEMTNNQAEYRALLLALEEAAAFGASKDLHLVLHMDSELVARQLKGEYKVKNEGLRPLFREATAKISLFGKVEIKYIPREQNSAADALANEALDNEVL